MATPEKQKLDGVEKNNKAEAQNKRKIEEQKATNESHNNVRSLAEKIFLQPTKDLLKGLKSLILPEQIKKEVQEKISLLEGEKKQAKKEALGVSKKNLLQIQETIIPSVYREYAKKGSIEAAKAKSAGDLITEISAGIHNPNPIARWAAEGLNRITRDT